MCALAGVGAVAPAAAVGWDEVPKGRDAVVLIGLQHDAGRRGRGAEEKGTNGAEETESWEAHGLYPDSGRIAVKMKKAMKPAANTTSKRMAKRIASP
jgi:hypothetical protein